MSPSQKMKSGIALEKQRLFKYFTFSKAVAPPLAIEFLGLDSDEIHKRHDVCFSNGGKCPFAEFRKGASKENKMRYTCL